MAKSDPSLSILHRTRLCTFFARGRCNRGDMCTFAHGLVDLKPKPDLTQTKLCPMRGRCKNQHCRFAHSWYELRYVKYKGRRKWSIYCVKTVHKGQTSEPVHQVETSALETTGATTSRLRQPDAMQDVGDDLAHATEYLWYMFLSVVSTYQILICLIWLSDSIFVRFMNMILFISI